MSVGHSISARRLLSAVLLIAAAAGWTQAATAAPAVGEPAPEFTGVDSDGNTHRLRDYRGKVVVLEWTNHECPFVGKHYGTGNMQALQKEAAARDVVWLSVVSSAPGSQGYVTPAEAKDVAARHGAAPAATLLDPLGVIGRAYGAKVTPHMYIVDAQGTMVYMGGIDDRPTARWRDVEGATNHVRTALAEVLAGDPVSEPVTRPYGCTVKYAD